MAKRKKENLEYRHYELEQDFPVLALWGDKWIQKYEKMNCLHFHNHLEIGYCNWGEGDLYLESDVYRFNSGIMTFIPKNIPHSTDSDCGTVSSWEYLFVDIDTIFGEGKTSDVWKAKSIIKHISSNAYVLNEKENPQIALVFKEAIKEMKSPGKSYKTKMRALLMLLFIEIEKLSAMDENAELEEMNMQILPALEFIRYNYMNDIKIGVLAKKCNLSETHFRRVFNEIMKVSPLDYINEVRIHASCNLLRTTDDSIESIAIKSGYSTITTYNRNFNKIMKMTPNKWRNMKEHKEKNLNNYRITKLEGWL